MNDMKGLDDWITGVHDPNAPFNQTDWVDDMRYVIDECDWLTDEILDDPETESLLCDEVYRIFETYLPSEPPPPANDQEEAMYNDYFAKLSKIDIPNLKKEKAAEIAAKLKAFYDDKIVNKPTEP